MSSLARCCLHVVQLSLGSDNAWASKFDFKSDMDVFLQQLPFSPWLCVESERNLCATAKSIRSLMNHEVLVTEITTLRILRQTFELDNFAAHLEYCIEDFDIIAEIAEIERYEELPIHFEEYFPHHNARFRPGSFDTTIALVKQLEEATSQVVKLFDELEHRMRHIAAGTTPSSR